MVAAADRVACRVATAPDPGDSLGPPQIAALMDRLAQARAAARVGRPWEVVVPVRVPTVRRPRTKAPAWITLTAVVLASVAPESLPEDLAEGTVVFTRC